MKHGPLAALTLLLAAPAHADELRFGVMDHNTDALGIAADAGTEDGPSIAIDYAWDGERVAPFVTVSANVAGDMSFAAAGFELRFDGETWSARPALGVAVHDGCIDECAAPSNAITNQAAPLHEPRVGVNMGSRALFYLRLDVGRRITDEWAVYLRVEHLSNGDLADLNPAMDQVGLVFVRRF